MSRLTNIESMIGKQIVETRVYAQKIYFKFLDDDIQIRIEVPHDKHSDIIRPFLRVDLDEPLQNYYDRFSEFRTANIMQVELDHSLYPTQINLHFDSGQTGKIFIHDLIKIKFDLINRNTGEVF